MQPLIAPIDHESRSNPHRSQDGPDVSEDTPLLSGRFPSINDQATTDRTTTAIVTMLIFMLITGVVIGIYLLVQQYNADNILPPVDSPLELISRSQWDPRNRTRHETPFKAHHVIVVQTDTQPCWNKDECEKLLLVMQNKTTTGTLPYNFLISSNGQTFEALGWRRTSILFPPLSNVSLVLAVIGEFSATPPTWSQVDALHKFIDESVSQRHLDAAHTIITRNTRSSPLGLFEIIKRWPQWDQTYSDF